MRGLLVAFCFLFYLAVDAVAAQDARPLPSPSGAPFVRAHRSVTTSDVAAQRAFDDGLTLLYAFNPDEARRSFERAAHDDPGLAMAWWGIAMSHGVNINTSFDSAEQRRGRDAIAKSASLANNAMPVERALIGAAGKRFAYDRPSDSDRSARAYRDAMDAVAATYPADDDVLTLAAEAEMDVHPWSYFTNDGQATPGTPRIIERLQTVLARDPAHLGANHFVIHALEESPHPEAALAAARRLASDNLEPAAEHLAHMPAHAFMRSGLYHGAGDANARAIEMYRTYLAGDPAGHSDYFAHDCTFGVDAYMMSGEYAAARRLATVCARGTVGMGPLVDLRFRRWDALANDGTTTDLGAGMLAARDAHFDAAATHLGHLRASGGDVGTILAALVTARVAQTKGDPDAEIAALKVAVAKQDGFGYSEPPTFWYPVRETLGGAYYRAHRYADAERTFRDDLVRNPDNPRSLFGLARTLEAQGRANDAHAVQLRFAKAWEKADVALDMKDL